MNANKKRKTKALKSGILGINKSKIPSLSQLG